MQTHHHHHHHQHHCHHHHQIHKHTHTTYTKTHGHRDQYESRDSHTVNIIPISCAIYPQDVCKHKCNYRLKYRHNVSLPAHLVRTPHCVYFANYWYDQTRRIEIIVSWLWTYAHMTTFPKKQVPLWIPTSKQLFGVIATVLSPEYGVANPWLRQAQNATKEQIDYRSLGPLLLTWFNFNPSMDK